ncbi:hypothetical protein RIB2604_00101720 [Aspergillus luchuensis]|uniref:Uncharacterized protein n=1 Tax=Aspergillus kawachii TaxID=1069201 RepID=A0A146EXB2_ASPKA|nr:hypothetical protein RIB2604_00101720 [Aspergillus luchuensis]
MGLLEAGNHMPQNRFRRWGGGVASTVRRLRKASDTEMDKGNSNFQRTTHPEYNHAGSHRHSTTGEKLHRDSGIKSIADLQI